ncbi:MAG: Hsp20/alpha crystallin family protein [Desulfovibrio sp.]|nr:Hsp20/alpha crystallin family protein [Desulfovibrio sp.]
MTALHFTPARWFRVHPDTQEQSGNRHEQVAVARLHNDIDRLFDGLLGPWFNEFPVRGRGAGILMPKLDVHSDDKEYVITVELPGVPLEHVSLEVRENMLRLSGEKKETREEKGDTHVSERRYGSFERALSLPEDAVVEDIKASHKDGILTVTIPKKSPEKASSRVIEINQG